MEFVEMGKQDGKTLMLPPGTACDYQTNFAAVLDRLGEKYHLICVNYDRARRQPIRIITGHTGWTDDLDFAFRHRTEICKPFTKKYTDTSAPYDGYIEDDDTEESARSILLRKVAVR